MALKSVAYHLMASFHEIASLYLNTQNIAVGDGLVMFTPQQAHINISYCGSNIMSNAHIEGIQAAVRQHLAEHFDLNFTIEACSENYSQMRLVLGFKGLYL